MLTQEQLLKTQTNAELREKIDQLRLELNESAEHGQSLADELSAVLAELSRRMAEKFPSVE